MVASEMATSVVKPPKLPKGTAAPRAKSTNSHQTTKHTYTRTFKSNSSVNVNSVYKSRSDTSLTNSIRNLSLRSGSASSRSSASSSTTSGSRRFNSAGHGSKTVEDIARQIAGNYFKNIVVMAGAGISTASGIPDFRTPGTGLYDNLRQYRIPYPQAIFDIDYFSRCPKPFYTLAKELYPTGRHRPNYVHYFLRLLYEKGILLRVYTQNIDGLERLAGIPSAKLIEAHGSFLTASCVQCKQAYPESEVKGAILGDKVPRCKKPGCFGLVKPDIVFFGEDLPRRFYYYLRDFPQADLLLVMGTSLEVEPFADIVDSVRMYVPRVLFNREAVGPFEKKRRVNDIVVEGDIVEKVRGFAVQLGWKKELDILIEESENQYKKSLIESPTTISKNGPSDFNISLRNNKSSTSPTRPCSPINKPRERPSYETQTTKLDSRLSQTPQKETKAEESETQSNTRNQATRLAQAPQESKAPASQNKTGDQLIAGPNSCFNPAQLRLSSIGRSWTTGSQGLASDFPKPDKLKKSGSEAFVSESRADRDKERGPAGGATGGGGAGGGGGIDTVFQRDNESKEKTKTDSSEPEHNRDLKEGQEGSNIAEIRRQPFGGVGLLSPQINKVDGSDKNTGPQNQDSDITVKKSVNDMIIEANDEKVSVEASSTYPNKTCGMRGVGSKQPDADDDLKGFFTMPTPSEKSRKEVHSADVHIRHGSGRRSNPRATEICTKPDSDGAKRPETSCEDRVNEWFSKNESQQGESQVGTADVSDFKESSTPNVCSDLASQKPPVFKRHKTTMITRELVRLKMRANLQDQAKGDVPLFQHRTLIPQDDKPVSKPLSERMSRPSKCITPSKLLSKPGTNTGVRSPTKSPSYKPLFTGLRHVSIKTKPVTATITKTTMDTSGPSLLRYKIDAPSDHERLKIHSAGGLPRMSYHHRMPHNLPGAGNPNAMANLFPKAVDSPQTDQICNKVAKVGSAI